MLVCDSFAEIYERARIRLLNAQQISPRDNPTREITPFSFKLTNPRDRLAYHPDRKFNLIWAMAEAMMLFRKSKELRHFQVFNEAIKDFSDDGTTLHGAYGNRVAPYFADIIAKLKNDVNTRQAILNIYDRDDSSTKTKDIPCTIALNFLIRNNKLDLHVYMRSNDFVWGLPYDLFNFTICQEVIANTLGIDVGNYYHTATSFHIYDKHIDLISNISAMEPISFSIGYILQVMQAMSENVIDYFSNDYTILMKDNQFYDVFIAEKEYRKFKKLDKNSSVPTWAQNFCKRYYR